MRPRLPPELAAAALLTAFGTGIATAGAACSSTANGTISLTTGGESDTFSRAPAPTSLHFDAVDVDGGVTALARAALPATTIDLPNQDVNEVASLRATGLDANGNKLVWGQTLPLQLGALEGLTLSLFVQRTGELARMPGPFPSAPSAPLVSLVLGRYLFAASGTAAQIYDLVQLGALTSPPTLPRAPSSLAVSGTRVLLVDATGATWFDLSDSSTTDAQVPTGGAYSEVAGGATVTASDGGTYIVGATRAMGGPTPRLLFIDPQGNLSFASLTAPRQGAAAAWIGGNGLVVAGGSATAAGVEQLAEGAGNAVALAYPPDGTTGAGATALDATHILLGGGVGASGASAGARVLDLGCNGTSCTPVSWTAIMVSLASTQAFSLDPTSALVVGSESSGTTHAFRASANGASEIAFKVQRNNARAVALPTGAVAVVGGDATIESFAP